METFRTKLGQVERALIAADVFCGHGYDSPHDEAVALLLCAAGLDPEQDIEELQELHKGKHVRWIRKNNGKLTNGGIIVDIKFYETGTQILCMGSGKSFIQYKYDECFTFQKMSEAEQLVVMAYEYANK